MRFISARLLVTGWFIMLCTGLFGSTAPVAAYTTVVTTESELAQAIRDANQYPGLDTIDLAGHSIILSDNYSGALLPRIESEIIIQNGHLIGMGPENAPVYGRFFLVTRFGHLTLRSMWLERGGVGSEDGGAILNQGTLIVQSSRFMANDAVYGGAIYSTRDSSLTVEDSLFVANTAGSGGAIAVRDADDVLISRSIFEQNSVQGRGGAIFIASGSAEHYPPMDISDSYFAENDARSGGAVFLESQIPTTFSLMYNTFSGNTATRDGGAISHEGESIVLVNNIISGNYLADGGRPGSAIFSQATSNTLINNTISGNNAPGYHSVVDLLGEATIINNIIYGNNPASDTLLIPAGDMVQVEYNIFEGISDDRNLNVDPLFVQPESFMNAPSTAGDYRLQFGSPAIDSGSNTGATDNAIGADDLDGNPRFADIASVVDTGEGTAPMIDRGAYEMQFLPVDVNRDGIVSPSDAVYVINRLQSGDMSADVDSDDNVNTVDVQMVLNALGN